MTPSTDEEHYCDKRAYPDKRAAQSQINRLTKGRRRRRRNRPTHLRAYYCETCQAWHLTKQR